MNTPLKYLGIALGGIFFWAVSGFVHEGQLINACEKGKTVTTSHPSYNLQGCKLVRR